MAARFTHIVTEKSDADTRPVLRSLAWLLVVTLLVAVGLVYLTHGLVAFESRRDPPPAPLAEAPGRLPPEPRLQTRPFEDIRVQREREQRLLHEYAWVDRPAGVVRIPIERAMDLVVERGLPVEPGAQAMPGAAR
jgi:hypothetical protein